MNFSVYNTFPIGKVSGVFNGRKMASKPIFHKQDNFNTNSELDKYIDNKNLLYMLNSNPVILSLLKANNIKPVINTTNFKNTTYKHCVDTKNIATGIYNNLPVSMQQNANLKYIQKGAVLHDLGKVLIPERIINKKGKLNDNEIKIMHLHSKIGEALLSSQNIEPEVLNIIKYHHQNRTKTGYPAIQNALYGYDLNTEIVSLADKYSALTEKRAYKSPMEQREALSLLKNDVKNGNVSEDVYNALLNYVKSEKDLKDSAVAA